MRRMKARKRRGVRKRTRFPAFFEAGDHQGPATLCEVSYSGARFETQHAVPEHRSTVRAYVWPPSQAEPFELVGVVIGKRPDGFAIEFEQPGQQICQWIDALQAEAAASPPQEKPVETR